MGVASAFAFAWSRIILGTGRPMASSLFTSLVLMVLPADLGRCCGGGGLLLLSALFGGEIGDEEPCRDCCGGGCDRRLQLLLLLSSSSLLLFDSWSISAGSSLWPPVGDGCDRVRFARMLW